jgi:ABC-type phosphate transport system substrate-binding protein
MNQRLCSLAAIALGLVWLAGCGPAEKKASPTSGSAFIYASSSTVRLGVELAGQFEGYYSDARIDFAELRTRAAVESLLFGPLEQIFLDRPLAKAESLVAAGNNIPIYQYPVATLPLCFGVHPDNPVRAIDSVALRKFLTGTWESWDEVGGPDIPCHPYVPLPGEGGWEVLMNYFGLLDTVIAVICTTQAGLIEKAEMDPGALAVVSLPISQTHLRKLWWRTGSIEIPPNIKTIVEPPCYPFKLTIAYITNRQKSDVAAGFLTFIVSNAGQKVVADTGYRPATIPVRVVEMF